MLVRLMIRIICTILLTIPSNAASDVTEVETLPDIAGTTEPKLQPTLEFEKIVTLEEKRQLCENFSSFLKKAHQNRTNIDILAARALKRDLIFIGESHSEPQPQRNQFYRDFMKSIKRNSPHPASEVCLFLETDKGLAPNLSACNQDPGKNLLMVYRDSNDEPVCPGTHTSYNSAVNEAYTQGFKVYAIDDNPGCGIHNDVINRMLDIMQCRDNVMMSEISRLMAKNNCKKAISINGLAHLTPTRPNHEPIGTRDIFREDGSQISTFNINLAFLGFQKAYHEPYDSSVNWYDNKKWIDFRWANTSKPENITESFLRNVYPDGEFLLCNQSPFLENTKGEFATMHHGPRDFPLYWTRTDGLETRVGTWTSFDATYFLRSTD